MSGEKVIEALNEAHGDTWALYHADCVEVARQLPENSVDFSVYSPPFANLYIYSDSERDMGNVDGNSGFIESYGFLVKELYRITRPGRLVAVHCKDLPRYKTRDGQSGIFDFPGELIRIHEAHGFQYHSRVTIWKCPVTEMQRSKPQGLLYKQLRKDASFSRQGMAEYVIVFRKVPEDGAKEISPVTHDAAEFPVSQWQEWASPVWMNIDQTDVLNVKVAREDKDEKHICPLQLDLIERCIVLWSNKGDVVFSPFTGIGSEGYVATKLGRKFIGTELKEAYFNRAVRNLKEAQVQNLSLFADGAA